MKLGLILLFSNLIAFGSSYEEVELKKDIREKEITWKDDTNRTHCDVWYLDRHLNKTVTIINNFTANVDTFDNNNFNFTYFPDNFGEKFYMIKCLKIIGANLQEIHRRDFENLKDLKALFLTKNKIKYLEQNLFFQNINLQKINLRQNKITCVHPFTANLKRLKHLKSFALAENPCSSTSQNDKEEFFIFTRCMSIKCPENRTLTIDRNNETEIFSECHEMIEIFGYSIEHLDMEVTSMNQKKMPKVEPQSHTGLVILNSFQMILIISVIGLQIFMILLIRKLMKLIKPAYSKYEVKMEPLKKNVPYGDADYEAVDYFQAVSRNNIVMLNDYGPKSSDDYLKPRNEVKKEEIQMQSLKSENNFKNKEKHDVSVEEDYSEVFGKEENEPDYDQVPGNVVVGTN